MAQRLSEKSWFAPLSKHREFCFREKIYRDQPQGAGPGSCVTQPGLAVC